MKTNVDINDLRTLIDEAEKEEHIFFGKVLVIEYKLKNGFIVQGRAAVVDPKNFLLDVGRQVARLNAIEQLWQLEGYKLQEKLYQSGLLNSHSGSL